MSDDNVFIEGSCRNIVVDNETIGYELQTNSTYYPGIPLSMVKDIRVKTDGMEEARDNIHCSVDDGRYWYNLDEMMTIIGRKWDYGEPMTVRVARSGGLAGGEHKVELTVVVRTVHLSEPLEGRMERAIAI